MSEQLQSQTHLMALHSYESSTPEDLEFHQGDTILLLSKGELPISLMRGTISTMQKSVVSVFFIILLLYDILEELETCCCLTEHRIRVTEYRSNSTFPFSLLSHVGPHFDIGKIICVKRLIVFSLIAVEAYIDLLLFEKA